jgi:hypothetical protein
MIWYHSHAVGRSVDQSPIRQERIPAPPRGGPMARRGPHDHWPRLAGRAALRKGPGLRRAHRVPDDRVELA